MERNVISMIHGLPNDIQQLILTYILEEIKKPFGSHKTKEKQKDRRSQLKDMLSDRSSPNSYQSCALLKKKEKSTSVSTSECEKNYLTAFYAVTQGMIPVQFICFQRKFLKRQDLSIYEQIRHLIICDESCVYNDDCAPKEAMHDLHFVHSNYLIDLDMLDYSEIENIKTALYIRQENQCYYNTERDIYSQEIDKIFPKIISLQTKIHSFPLRNTALQYLDIDLGKKCYIQEQRISLPNLKFLIIKTEIDNNTLKPNHYLKTPQLIYIFLKNMKEMTILEGFETLKFIFLLESSLKNDSSTFLRPTQFMNKNVLSLYCNIKGRVSFEKTKYLKTHDLYFLSYSLSIKADFQSLELLEIKCLLVENVKNLPELNNLRTLLGSILDNSKICSKFRNLQHFVVLKSSMKILQSLSQNCSNINTIATKVELSEKDLTPDNMIEIPTFKKLRHLILHTTVHMDSNDLKVTGLDSLKQCEEIILFGITKTLNENLINCCVKRMPETKFIQMYKSTYKKIKSEWIKRKQFEDIMFTYSANVTESRKIRNRYIQLLP